MKCKRVELDNREMRVHFEGALDATTALEVRPLVDAVVNDNPHKVTVDVSEVDFIDSSGVAVLVALFKRVRETGGTVRVVGAQEQPLAVLKLLSIDRLLCG